MKFTLCIVALTIMVSVEAAPAPGDITLPAPNPEYFENKLKSIKGAIMDTLRAGQDLETMEGKLQGIVDASSYFFRTESATEYATTSDAYTNGWAALGALGAQAKYNLTPGHRCLENYTPITSSWQDCKTAAEELGFTGDSVAHVDYDYAWGSSRPQGCYQSDGNGRFHFNKGDGGNSIGDDKILCVRQD